MCKKVQAAVVTYLVNLKASFKSKFTPWNRQRSKIISFDCVILFITDEICIFFWILYFYSQSIQTHTYFTEHLVGPAIFVFLIGWG